MPLRKTVSSAWRCPSFTDGAMPAEQTDFGLASARPRRGGAYRGAGPSGGRKVLAVGKYARQPEQNLGSAHRVALHQIVDEMSTQDENLAVRSGGHRRRA